MSSLIRNCPQIVSTSLSTVGCTHFSLLQCVTGIIIPRLKVTQACADADHGQITVHCNEHKQVRFSGCMFVGVSTTVKYLADEEPTSNNPAPQFFQSWGCVATQAQEPALKLRKGVSASVRGITASWSASPTTKFLLSMN